MIPPATIKGMKAKGHIKDAIKSQEQAVAILRKLPNSERALARTIFYCSTYQQDHGKTVDEEVDKESFRLYQKHAGAKAKEQKDLTMQDFDNLLAHNCR